MGPELLLYIGAFLVIAPIVIYFFFPREAVMIFEDALWAAGAITFGAFLLIAYLVIQVIAVYS